MTYEEALKEVLQDWRDLAHAIRIEDRYAPHVTEQQKDESRDKMIDHADSIERGDILPGFTIQQRVHYKMTGECPAFLPPRKATA